MEETITLPTEINRLCRTCMTVASDDGQFCENALLEEFRLTHLGMMLQDLTSSEITDDGLPTVLCNSCVSQLKQAFSYKKQCDEIQSSLKELLIFFDNRDNNCEEEFESKFIESDNFQFSHADSANEFECKICTNKFDSRYKLCRDMIEHNKDKSLSVRYHENSSEDTKENIMIERVISDDVLNLVKNRKLECIETINTPFEIELSDQKSIVVEDDINKVLEIVDANCLGKSDKTVKKIVFLSNKDSIKNTEIIRTDQIVNKNIKKIPSQVTCKHCSKKFPNRNKFKLHNCVNKQNKSDDGNEDNLAEHPTSCDLCNKVFPNNLMISIHFIYHVLLEESIKNSELLQEWIFCDFCGQVFETEEGMIEHRQSKHDHKSPSFLCERCGISFDKDMDLILHDDQHHADYDLRDSYRCPICNDSFECKFLLLDHGVNHLMKKICCRACRLEFCSQASLNEHMKIHPRYKYICNICGKCLSSSGALKSHMMGIHNHDSLYMCTTCGKCFKTSNRLRIHKDIHSAHKKYMCSYCGYRSHKSGDLKLHLRIHTSEHPYKCTFVNCNRVFKTSSHFNQHIRRHLDIKQYQCSYCSRKFSHSYTLKLHKMRHTGEKPHSCIICNVKFRRRDHVRIHMKQHEK